MCKRLCWESITIGDNATFCHLGNIKALRHPVCSMVMSESFSPLYLPIFTTMETAGKKWLLVILQKCLKVLHLLILCHRGSTHCSVLLQYLVGVRWWGSQECLVGLSQWYLESDGMGRTVDTRLYPKSAETE